MEYLVPVLAVVVIGALAFAAARWMSAGRARQAADQRTSSGRGLDIGPERARLAAGLLDEDAHRRVYGHIAQSRVMEAVRDYRAHTGRGLKDAVMDVQSLAVHPQVYSEPVQEPDATSAGAAGPVPADHGEPHRDDAAPAETPGPKRPGQDPNGRGEPDAQTPDRETPDAVAEDDARQDADHDSAAPPADELTTLTVPAEWTAAPAEEELPFEVEVMRGTESVRLSSQDLPPWLRDQLSAMVRDGNLESAAVQLSSHSELSVPEAYELLRRMRERRGEG